MGRVSRRQLICGAVVLLAAGAGTSAATLRRLATAMAPPRPLELFDAAAREHTMIAAIDVAVAADASLHGLLDPIRADHAAHLRAIQALLGPSAEQSPPAGTAALSAATPAPGRGGLLASERAAQLAAASASSSQSGATAVLFASISACEAAHVALLT